MKNLKCAEFPLWKQPYEFMNGLHFLQRAELLAFLVSCSEGNTIVRAVKLPELSTASSTVINGKLMLTMDPLPGDLSFLIPQFVSWKLIVYGWWWPQGKGTEKAQFSPQCITFFFIEPRIVCLTFHVNRKGKAICRRRLKANQKEKGNCHSGKEICHKSSFHKEILTLHQHLLPSLPANKEV